MSWVQVAWPMLAAASLTLGLIHALIWVRAPSAPQHLAFACAALSLCVLTVLELIALEANTTHELAGLIRWMHVPVAALVVSLVAFVRLSFGPRFVALGAAAVVLRLVALVANFTTGVNLNFVSIESLGHVEWPGDVRITYPIGPPNAWVLVGQISNLLIIAYMVTVLVAALRSGDAQQQRHAVVICGGWILFVGVMMTAAALMTLNVGKAPFIGSPSFVFVIAAMSYLLGSNLFESNRLEVRLRQSELERLQGQRDLHLAAEAAGLGLWSWNIPEDRVVGSPTARQWLGGCEGDGQSDLAGIMRKIHPVDRPQVRTAIELALESGRFETLFRLSHPGERWVTARVKWNSMSAQTRS